MTKPAAAARPQALRHILFDQGFGTRRECDGLLQLGLVRLGHGRDAGRVLDDGDEPFLVEGLALTVDGQPWQCQLQALVMLHKPGGYECSQKPKSWPSVVSLLPAPLRRRGLQPVGRLDQDTTGLLLLTDDGALIHRLTHPKQHVPKVYEIACDQVVDAAQLRQLLHGVVLHDDPLPVRAEACEITGEKTLRMTLVQGKYHQVKRMLAAVGNHVVGLHRSRYGALDVPADLAPGQWRWVAGLAAILPELGLAATAPGAVTGAAPGAVTGAATGAVTSAVASSDTSTGTSSVASTSSSTTTGAPV